VTQRPFLSETRGKAVRAAVALCVVLVAVLLAAGCTTKPALDNPTGTFTLATVTPTMQQSKELNKRYPIGYDCEVIHEFVIRLNTTGGGY